MNKDTGQKTIETAIQAIQQKLAKIDREIAKHKIPAGTVFFFDSKGKKIADGSTQHEWIHPEQTARRPDQSVMPEGTASIVSNGNIRMDIIAGDAEKIITDKRTHTTQVFGHLPVKLLARGNVEAGEANIGASIVASGDICIDKGAAINLTSGGNISVAGTLYGENEAKGKIEAGGGDSDASILAGGDIRLTKGGARNLTSGGNISVAGTLYGENEAKGAVKAEHIGYDATITAPIVYLQEGINVSSLKAKVAFIPQKYWDTFPLTIETPAFAMLKEVTPRSRSEHNKLFLESTCKDMGGTMKEVTSEERGFDSGLLCLLPKHTDVRQK